VAEARAARPRRAFDLLRTPALGPFLHWRHARSALQLPMLMVAILVLYDGLFGPQLAPRNLAGVAPWVQGRGVAVLALLLAGNLTCMACPFALSRNAGKKLLGGRRNWPKRLQGKWLVAGLLLVFFWFYELFDPWALPWLTAVLAAGYFAGAFIVNGAFSGMSFCKYLCPLGHFNFVNSLASPVEVRIHHPEVCTVCATKDCLRGRGGQRGCELWLFQQRKVGNMDCTFCLDCARACPNDNVGLLSRLPGSELWDERPRAGIGRFSDRVDLAALALVLVFGAFLNAFGMVGPFYPFAEGLARLLGTNSEGMVLTVIFGVGMLLMPVAVVGTAAWVSRALARSRQPILSVAIHHSLALVPLGFGMWLAHYSFHFLTGALTLIPVAQSFLVDIGMPFLGQPNWSFGPLVPGGWLVPIELVLLELGWLATLLASYRATTLWQIGTRGSKAAFLPWGLVATTLFLWGVWLMLQPMEMRGILG